MNRLEAISSTQPLTTTQYVWPQTGKTFTKISYLLEFSEWTKVGAYCSLLYASSRRRASVGPGVASYVAPATRIYDIMIISIFTDLENLDIIKGII